MQSPCSHAYVDASDPASNAAGFCLRTMKVQHVRSPRSVPLIAS
jgi:hypothetical protein